MGKWRHMKSEVKNSFCDDTANCSQFYFQSFMRHFVYSNDHRLIVLHRSFWALSKEYFTLHIKLFVFFYLNAFCHANGRVLFFTNSVNMQTETCFTVNQFWTFMTSLPHISFYSVPSFDFLWIHLFLYSIIDRPYCCYCQHTQLRSAWSFIIFLCYILLQKSLFLHMYTVYFYCSYPASSSNLTKSIFLYYRPWF